MNVPYMLGYGRSFNKLLRRQSTFRVSYGSKADVEIKIPPRIERGPLDILKALSATVKVEPDVPGYKLMSGVIFTSLSNPQKRSTSLAFDSGRKAAKWIVDKNPKLFQHKVAEPYIKAFAPPNRYNKGSEVSEEVLLGAIEDIKVSEAMTIYNILKAKNIDVSQSTKQKLLELTCYYNSTDKPDETLVETEYFESGKALVVNNWKESNFAETLFKEMEPTIEAVSALILGLFKYKDVKNAMETYMKAAEEGIIFPVEVYNAVIEHAGAYKYEFDEKHQFIIGILRLMAANNITPNSETMNSALRAISAIRKWFKAREFSMKIFSEFTELGIEPSLATYYYILDIFYDHQHVSDIILHILARLESKPLVLSHVDDFKFFVKAMEISCYNFQKFSVAERVHSLLNSGRNISFLRGNYAESLYYRAYLICAFRHGDIDEAMKVYKTITPYTHMPEISTYLVILGRLQETLAWRHLPQIWKDIKSQITSDKIVNILVHIVDQASAAGGGTEFLTLAKEAWEKTMSERKSGLDSEIMSAFVNVFSREQETEMAYMAFEKARSVPDLELSTESLMLFLDVCLQKKDKTMAMECLKYSNFTEKDVFDRLMKKAISGFEFSEEELKAIKKLKKLQKPESPEELSM